MVESCPYLCPGWGNGLVGGQVGGQWAKWVPCTEKSRLSVARALGGWVGAVSVVPLPGPDPIPSVCPSGETEEAGRD